MKTLNDLATAKITADVQITGTHRLWLDKIVIAAGSWHEDFAGLITAPPIGDHREDWLVDCCGGEYPDFSASAEGVVKNVLEVYWERIVEYFEDYRDTKLLSHIQAQIRRDALKEINERRRTK